MQEDAFSCYAPYCANFQGASELVEELKPDLMVRAHLSISSRPSDSLNLAKLHLLRSDPVPRAGPKL